MTAADQSGTARWFDQGNTMKTTKCPVCDWEIKDGGIKVKVAGKEITVCCDDCARQAQADPKKYAAAH
jgi:ribosome-binding protein aMBF1 (putative translation factor)